MWVLTGRVVHVKIPRSGSDPPAAPRSQWPSPRCSTARGPNGSSRLRSSSDSARRPTGPPGPPGPAVRHLPGTSPVGEVGPVPGVLQRSRTGASPPDEGSRVTSTASTSPLRRRVVVIAAGTLAVSTLSAVAPAPAIMAASASTSTTATVAGQVAAAGTTSVITTGSPVTTTAPTQAHDPGRRAEGRDRQARRRRPVPLRHGQLQQVVGEEAPRHEVPRHVGRAVRLPRDRVEPREPLEPQGAQPQLGCARHPAGAARARRCARPVPTGAPTRSPRSSGASATSTDATARRAARCAT